MTNLINIIKTGLMKLKCKFQRNMIEICGFCASNVVAPQPPPPLFLLCSWLQTLACVCMFISHHRSRIIDFNLITATGVGVMGAGGMEYSVSRWYFSTSKAANSSCDSLLCLPYGKGTVKAPPTMKYCVEKHSQVTPVTNNISCTTVSADNRSHK